MHAYVKNHFSAPFLPWISFQISDLNMQFGSDKNRNLKLNNRPRDLNIQTNTKRQSFSEIFMQKMAGQLAIKASAI